MTRRRLIDIGLPLVLAMIASAEVAFGSDIHAPWPAVAVFVLGTTIPLIWRRRAPLVVLVVTFGCIAIPDAAYGMGNNASGPFAGVLVATYASGAYTSARDGRFAAGIIALVVVIMAVAIGEDVVGDVVFIGGIMFAVWGAATVVRSRQELAGALAARTVELEHEREEKARLAVVEERARIARELHDVVAHSLSMMIVQAGAERHVVGAERPQTSAVLATIEETGRGAMAEMRRLLGLLRRSDDELALAPQPSLEGLPALVDQVREAGVGVDLRVEGEPRPIPPGIDLSAYRIVQEALTNTLKHAGPVQALVRVRYGAGELEIEVTDEGPAVATETKEGGHGLVGMRERAALLGGDLAAGRQRGGGYAVRARLPLPDGAP